jgi:hypothetical protein
MRVAGLLSTSSSISISSISFSHTPNYDEYLLTCAFSPLVIIQTTQKLLER